MVQSPTPAHRKGLPHAFEAKRKQKWQVAEIRQEKDHAESGIKARVWSLWAEHRNQTLPTKSSFPLGTQKIFKYCSSFCLCRLKGGFGEGSVGSAALHRQLGPARGAQSFLGRVVSLPSCPVCLKLPVLIEKLELGPRDEKRENCGSFTAFDKSARFEGSALPTD